MIESYAVGVTLRLHDLVTPALAKIAIQFKELDFLTAGLNKNLKAMGLESAGIRKVSAATASLSNHMASAGVNSGILEKRIADIQKLRGIGAGNNGGGGGGGGNRHGGLHVGGNGVGLPVTSIGLGQATVPLAVGAASVYGMSKLYGGARDYETVFQRFKALNLGDTINAEADKFARGTHSFGVSSIELMTVLSESVGLFGSFEEARKYSPKIAALSKANSAIFQGKTGELDEHGMMGLLKFIDRRGGFKDDQSFDRNVDLAEKLVTGSGGRIKFSDLDQFSQRGGTAFRGMSDEGIMGMAGLIIEQGGNASGVAMMSLYQNLIAGRATKKAIKVMEQLGLAGTAMQTHGKLGAADMKALVTTHVKDADLLQSDPRRWFNETLMPALAQHGITDQSMIIRTVNDMLSNRTASNQATIYTAQSLQLERDYKLTKGALGAKQVQALFSKTGIGAEEDFGAAWSEFKVEMGKNILPAFTAFLHGASAFIRGVNDFANENKTMFDWMSKNSGGPLATVARTASSIGTSIKDFAFGSNANAKQGDVYIDGKKAGEVLTPHVTKIMSKEAQRPTAGTNNFDGSMSPLPIGGAVAGGW